MAIDATNLIELYRKRLDLSCDLPPIKETLQLLVQRHLERLPFENTCLHRKQNDPIRLDYPSMIQKLLIDNRGGCCLELNGLFASFLKALGYTVHLVPCYVHAGKERGHHGNRPKFRITPTHFILLVNLTWLVDVGLGEPPMGPLEYTTNLEQTTVDGLVHRLYIDPNVFKDRKGKEKHCMILEWYRPTTNEWEPRLQWEYKHYAPMDGSACVPVELSDFSRVIDILSHHKSTFARKLIVCKLSPTCKTTLSGRTLRTTNRQTGAVESQECSDVSKVLLDEYGMDISDIDLTKSDILNNPRLWDHL